MKSNKPFEYVDRNIFTICNAITRFYKIGIGSWAAVSKHNTQCILVIGSLLLTIVMVTVI